MLATAHLRADALVKTTAAAMDRLRLHGCMTPAERERGVMGAKVRPIQHLDASAHGLVRRWLL
jgi:hypothetical protein